MKTGAIFDDSQSWSAIALPTLVLTCPARGPSLATSMVKAPEPRRPMPVTLVYPQKMGAATLNQFAAEILRNRLPESDADSVSEDKITKVRELIEC